ncbi:vesicle-associated protein 1-3 isoform X1 [Brachypodium distachyon]|uniref:MSP domain-containing protein n=1 Tax=Brachypodium distachyon TaxID=15368 RepID=I1ICB4_BRADI|nr:vesicle-associated protein 1-3 isoform X1 [Brachypodium distachyon]KQK00651.1 hypothetical protein BRADI_3g50857v3 [Brachypodium distachyon]|eukprot:XP_003570041.1 vesicle-associated protein 1-3 isoform X1 [Brachypodium distachyon]
MSNTLLRIYPSELKMPFELKKQNSGCIELVNKTDQPVAFKVKTTNPRKYAVRPTSRVVPPGGSCGVTITMQAPKEIPQDYHCKDKFLVQSIMVQEGITDKDIVPDMFIRAPGKVVEEFKLRVVYIPANPPSPVPEEDEEEIADSEVDHEVFRQSMLDAASRQGYTSASQALNYEDVFKLKSEVVKYTAENQKIQQELELLRKRMQSHGDLSPMFALLVFMLSVLVGYLMTGRNA